MKKKFIPLQEVKKRAFAKNPKVKTAYDEMEASFALVETFIKARNKAGLSQQELATRMGTTQSVVARIESGKTLPSLKTLYRYAHAAGMKPVIQFKPVSA